MSTLLEESVPAASNTMAARRLRTTMAAVRVSFTWFGVRKTLSPQQKAEAADTFGAAGNYLSAGKKLFDTSHPAFRAVTAVRTRAVALWRGISLPYPEPGIRLIRQPDIQTFDIQLTTLRVELDEAVGQLNEHLAELTAAARERLGRLYSSADYPNSLRGLFTLEYDSRRLNRPITCASSARPSTNKKKLA